MHELMDKVTETLIVWVKKQKEVIGEPLTECIGDQQVYTGEHAGVWFSDDDAVLMSAKTYREFVAPYNSRILKAFGGGVHPLLRQRDPSRRHFPRHGRLEGAQYLQPVQHPLGRRAAEKAPGRASSCSSATSPRSNTRNTSTSCLTTLSYRGLVVYSHYSPVVGLLRGGKYDAVNRDLHTGRRAVFEYLQGWFAQH